MRVCEVGYFSKRHDTHRRVVRVTDPSSAKDDGRDSGPRTTQRERSSSACEPTLGAVKGFTNIGTPSVRRVHRTVDALSEWVPSARGSHAGALVAPGLRNTDFDGPIAPPHAHTVRMRTCGAPKISFLILGLGSRPGPDPYKAYPVCPSSRPPSRTKVARSPTSERRAPVDFSPVDTVAGCRLQPLSGRLLKICKIGTNRARIGTNTTPGSLRHQSGCCGVMVARCDSCAQRRGRCTVTTVGRCG